MKLNYAGSPTVTTVEKLIDYIFSAGSLEDITITDNLDGTVSISSGKVLLREYGTENSKLISYTLSANSSVSLTDGSINYLSAVVSGTTAVVQSSTSMPDLYAEALLGIVFRSGTTLYIASINQSEKDLFKNILEYNLANKMKLVSGGYLQYLGSLKFKIYEAVLHNNLKNITFSQFDSTTQTFKYFIRQGTGLVTFGSAVNNINNTSYGDPIEGFKVLDTDCYNCQWVFITENGDVYIELDTINSTDINVAVATTYQKKNVPYFLKYNAIPVAKIIAKKGSTSEIYVMQAGNNEIINFIDTIKKFSYNNLSDVPTEFPPEAHTHDDRYYTETESDNRYLKKSADSDLDMNSNDITEIKTATSTEYPNGNSGTSKTINWNNGIYQKITMTENCVFSFTNLAGSTRLQLKLIQDSTGSRTASFPSGIKWVGKTAPILTTDANAEDIITFYFDGSSYYGMAGLNFGTV